MFGGILYVMQKIKVKNVIIAKQAETSDNLEKFLDIVNEKNINVIVVEMGDKVAIEKNLYFNILWPQSDNFVSENSINNNALVCKLYYKNFTMLFTGDIEEETEKKLISLYSDSKLLNSTVLKVAHHGSKSSSTEDFLNLVNPQFALIGVGKNNLYGHPNEDVLKRLENLGAIVYRTDKNGEITISTNGQKNSKIILTKTTN
jgi:competence protein ComEC